MTCDERPTHLDLFSGIGGFSFGLEAAGFHTVAFAETDPDASIVLDHYWPNVPNLGDVRHLRSGVVERPFIVTGGVPCQPASFLGQMRGTSDERWLWPEAIRILREFRPCYGIFENPPALLALEDGRAWNGVVSELVASRFDCWWDVFPAAAFGAGHLRERVILIVADANYQRRPEARNCILERAPGANHVRKQPSALDCSLAPDSDSPRLQGHTGHGAGGNQWSSPRRPVAPPDLRDRVTGPGWWHEVNTGIPVLVDGLPSRLVEAIGRCTGNAILPQIPFLIGNAILDTERRL